MRLSQILAIFIVVIVLAIILTRVKVTQRSNSPRRRRKNAESMYCPIHDSDSDSFDNSSSSRIPHHRRHENWTSRVTEEIVATPRKIVQAPTTPLDESHFQAQINFDPKAFAKTHPKPATVPTFARAQNGDERVAMSDHGYRFQVNAHVKSHIDLPKNFSAIKKWEGMIIGVYDQERCGSCWAFSTSSSFTDRIRIKSNGKDLANGDYLSPFHLAACMKCGIDGACPRVCEGNYLDDVLQYLVDEGGVAQSDIEKHSTQGEEYRCFNAAANGVKPWKGKRKYRVNIYPPNMLNNPKMLAENETAIMEDIYRNGSVNCIIKVYVPMDSRNFYLYKSGIYGYGWTSEPKETDGYHAINIVGWGEDETPEGVVKYWIVRNSWGDSWASLGFGRILRGSNFGMIEADVWAIEPQ